MMWDYDDHIVFNRYTDLDVVEGRIVEALIQSKTPQAMRMWNMLRDDSPNCLNNPNTELVIPLPKDATEEQIAEREQKWKEERSKRRALVYEGNGESSTKKVFLSPFTDDAWSQESSRIDIFVDDIASQNHMMSTVLIGVEILVHNKIVNIYNDADPYYEPTNPVELDNGEPWLRTKSRATCLLKSVLAELNGLFVEGVGQMQISSKMHIKSGVKRMVWNNRAYIGYSAIFATLMSGVGSEPGDSY